MAIKNPPKGYHSVTPTLSLTEAAKAIDLYRKAFGAEEQSRFLGPDGRIMHAEIRIGDSIIMVSDHMPEMGAPVTSSSLWIYTDDTDALYKRAVAAGAKERMPPTDAFWGDRFSQVEDLNGNRWTIATRLKEMSDDELRKAGEAAMKEMFGQAT